MTKTLWTVIFLGIAFFIPSAKSQDCVKMETSGGRLERCNEICVDFKVRDFKNVVSFQFSLNWNPRVMRLVRIFQTSTPLPAYTVNNNFLVLNGGGVIRTFWYDPNDVAHNLTDETVLFTMCFIATGLPGDQTEVRVGSYPLEIEFTDPNQDTICYQTKSTPITITPASKLCVNATACGTDGNTNSGSINVHVDGGRPNYTVTLNPGGTTQTVNSPSGSTTFNNLPPGNYTINVTDSNGNTETTTISLNDSPIKITPVRVLKPKCKGETGSILIEIEGGAGDSSTFGIHWMPGDVYGSKYYKRLQPGIYTVTVIDSLGCEATMSFDLSNEIFTTELELLDTSSCTNSLDGIAKATARGGKPYPGGTYKYFWSQNSDDANCDPPCVESINDSVSGRNQWVIIQDANNCNDTIFFDVPSHNELLIQSLIVEDSRCAGDSTGSVVLTAVSNNSTDNIFTFELTKMPGQVITGGITTNNKYEKYRLSPGKYIISVSDTNGCTFIDTFDIGSPPPMGLTLISADTVTTCTGGGFDGKIEVAGAGGNGPPYHYLWSNNEMVPSIDSLAPGTYTVTVTDDKGCDIVRTFTVHGPTPPEITGFDIKDVTCTGLNDGEVSVQVQAGSGAISMYNWSNGQNTQTATNLTAGTYTVTVTDEHGCTDIDTVQVAEPEKALTLDSFRLEHPSCPGESNGLIAVTVSGGTPDYSFQWSNGATTQLLVSVPAGSYTVTISDNGNCPDVVKTLTLVDPPHNTLTILDSAMVSCNDGKTCDGKVVAIAGGGKTPSLGYNFEWSSGEVSFGVTKDSATGLCQGRQWVVINNDYCSDTFYFTVGAPPKIRLTPQTALMPPSCYGYSDGSISLDIRGGVPSYDVLWKDMPVTGFVRSNLSSGMYSFFIKDFNNCIYEDSVFLPQPDSFVVRVNQTLTKSVRCNGDMDGRIALYTEGGNPGSRNYVWQPNVSTDSIAENLPAGTYRITSIDPKGCKDTVLVTLPNPPKINYELAPIMQPLCAGDKATVTVAQASGGNGPKFSFAINKGQKYDINEEVELLPGQYDISIYDSKGCSRDTSITINTPRKLEVVFDPSELELELGDSVTVCITSDVQPGDQIIWEPEGRRTTNDGKCIVVSETNSTTYRATLRDKNGCEVTNTFSVIVINRGRIFIPNIITKEGPNSIFKVYPGKGIRSVDFMRIYDRWGELIYNKENLIPDVDGWNGGFKNGSEKMNPGVYVYMVKVTYLNGESHIFRGDVTLLY